MAAPSAPYDAYSSVSDSDDEVYFVGGSSAHVAPDEHARAFYRGEIGLASFVPDAWKRKYTCVEDFLGRHEFIDLEEALRGEKNITPPLDQVFRALDLVGAPENVVIVILGQDPYPTRGHADGLAFSVSDGRWIPDSMKNILRQVNADAAEWETYASSDTARHSVDTETAVSKRARTQLRGMTPASKQKRTSNLTAWAKQGVLLLNTALTTRVGVRFAHASFGWGAFVNAVLRDVIDAHAGTEHVSEKKLPIFLLWGKASRELIEETARVASCEVITTSHPSPLSATMGGSRNPPFLGSMCFFHVNQLLNVLFSHPPIDWLLE